MRVTESRLLDIAQAGVAKGRDRYGNAASQASSGIRVNSAQDDPTAWAEAMRARAASLVAEGRGKSIEHARTSLLSTESSLTQVSDALSRARELTLQMSNGTLTDRQRSAAAVEIRDLRESILSALNAEGTTGEHLFGGTADAAFDPSGAYLGDTTTRAVSVGPATVPGSSLSVSVTGDSVATSAGGDPLFQTLDDLAAALDANDPVAVRSALDPLGRLIDRANEVRSGVGVRISALDDAEAARSSLQTALDNRSASLVGADMVDAASELARAQQVLETSRSVAQQVISSLSRA
ncbi:MAG: hypothetical protein U1E65_36310 [Myxococcota bacterium]